MSFDHAQLEKQLIPAVQDKHVIITGGSSGIGKKTAEIFAKAGAHVIIVARSQQGLDAAKAELSEFGDITTYSCDLSDLEAIDATAKHILAERGQVDILINNAGRSIRRAIKDSLDRFHDYQRTMAVNYFGAVRLIHALLPSMVARKSGHIINISSYGVMLNSAFFSAYIASKAALDAYSRCLAAEVRHQHIKVTTINMPLVRTPMIAPTKLYNYLPALNTYEAAMFIAHAAIHQPLYDSTKASKVLGLSNYALPELNVWLQNMAYKYTPRFGVEAGKENPNAAKLSNKIGRGVMKSMAKVVSKVNKKT